MTTSIIIPCFHDAAALGRTLDHLQRLAGISSSEIVVSAFGDTEGTTRAVGARARLLWPGGSTRAQLMNAGASAARGDVLCFLHADSTPPADALLRIDAALRNARIVGGAFEHRFAERTIALRVISWINRCRYRLTRNYYGDQGIFVRADVFRAIGGYPDLPLMEDLVFSQRLKRTGAVVLIREPLLTSGRRFLTRGAWRTFWAIVWLLALHTCGCSTRRYAPWWRGPVL